MAKLHILRAISGTPRFEAVLHAPVPDDQNSAGIPWPDLIKAVGLNVTRLTMGKGIGQITEEEAQLILDGKILENRLEWGEDVNLEAAVLEQFIRDGVVAGDDLKRLLDDGAARILPKPEKFGMTGSVEVTKAIAEDLHDEIVVDRRPPRGLDPKLDVLLDDAHEKAKEAYLRREVDDLIARVLGPLQWYGRTVE